MADFQNNLGSLRNAEASVVALSGDTREEARGTADLTGALFPIVYGLDAREVGPMLGAYMNEDPPFLHATAFILRPDGTVALAAYSSGSTPRMRANEAASFIQALKRKERDAAG